MEWCQSRWVLRECHHGVNSVSKVNEECQKWRLPLSDQIGRRRVKKGKKYGTHQHLGSWRKFAQISAPPAHTLKLVNVSPSCITQQFKLLPLHWDSERDLGSSRRKPSWFSKPDVTGLLPTAAPSDSDLLLFRGGTSEVVISLLLWVTTRKEGIRVGPNLIESLPLLPISVWFSLHP